VPQHGWNDERVESFLGSLLRAGVLLAALVVLAGGIRFLVKYGTQPSERNQEFHGEPLELRSISGILTSAADGHSRGIIQLGVLLLIATPIARVIFSVLAFAFQRDTQYVVFTLIVLAVLLYSLAGGHLLP
jgi:uncharacterized membrane protein